MFFAGPLPGRLPGPGPAEGDAAPGVGPGLVLAHRVHGAPARPERRAVAHRRGRQGQAEPGAPRRRRGLRKPGISQNLILHSSLEA